MEKPAPIVVTVFGAGSFGTAMAVVAAKRERDMSDSNAAGTAYNLDTIAAELGFTEYGQFYPG